MATWFGWLLGRFTAQLLFDGFRGRLRTTRMLWWLQGSDEDNKGGFCGHRNRLRTHNLT